MTVNTIEVHFVHPRNSTTLTADISPQCTGAEALQELQADDGSGPFLTPPQTGEFYGLGLKRGNSTVAITPNMTFTQAGVQSGDTVMVNLGGQGGFSRPTVSSHGENGRLRRRALASPFSCESQGCARKER